MSALQIGRLSLGPPSTPMGEALGFASAAIGSQIVSGARSPQALQISLNTLLNASSITAQGQSIRRRLRSLLNNPQLKDQAFLYLLYADDPELNAWLMPDPSAISSIDGVSFKVGMWQSASSSWWVLGRLRTHRQARLVWMKDLTQGVYARDTLEQIYLTDFSSITNLALTYLPVGAIDLKTGDQRVAQASGLMGADGSCPIVIGALDNQMVSFECAESSLNLSDTVLVDRRAIQTVYAFGHSWMAGYYASDWGGAFTDGGFGVYIAPDLGVGGAVAAALSANPLNYAVGGARASFPTYGPQPGGWAWVLNQVSRGTDPTAPVPPALYLLGWGINDLWDMPTSSLGPMTAATVTAVSRFRALAVFEDNDASVAYGSGWASVQASQPNLVAVALDANSISGWATTGTFLTAGATLTADTTAPLYIGDHIAKLVTTASSHEGALYAMTPGSPFTSGMPYTASLWLRGNAGGEQVTLLLGTGSDSASASATLTTSWQRFSVTWTPGSSAATAYVAVRTATASAVTFFANAVQVTQSPVAVPFSDQAIGLGSGTTMRQAPPAGSAATITVPASFQGGTIDLGFTTVSTALTPSGQSVWHYTIDGGPTRIYTIDGPSVVTPQNASGGGAIGTVLKLSGLSPGAHTITLSLAGQSGSLVSFFDYWQVQAQTPAPVILIGQYHALNYIIPGIHDADIDTLNANIYAAVSSFADGRVLTCTPSIPLIGANFASDGLHPSTAGHAYIAQNVETCLANLLVAGEEAYGPDHEWSWLHGGALDVPSLKNGLCRVDFDAASGNPGFMVRAYNPSVGAYVRQGKMFIFRVGDTSAYCDTLISSNVLSYTPERTVLEAVFANSADPYSQETVLVTLQRGWSGPRFEIYPAPKADGSAADATLLFWLYSYIEANASASKIDAGGGQIQATAGSGLSYFNAFAFVGTTYFNGENEAMLLRQLLVPPVGFSPSGPFQMNVAVLQQFDSYTVNTLASGSMVAIGSQNASGYVSAHLGFALQASDQIIEAEAFPNLASPTVTVVSDALASGGQMVRDTQTAQTNVTLSKTSDLLEATYRMFARVQVDSGAIGSFYAVYTGSISPHIVTSSATSLTWIDLGEISPSVANPALGITAWSDTGGLAVYIDRVELVLMDDQASATAQFSGARDLAGSVLYDSRQIGALISR